MKIILIDNKNFFSDLQCPSFYWKNMFLYFYFLRSDKTEATEYDYRCTLLYSFIVLFVLFLFRIGLCFSVSYGNFCMKNYLRRIQVCSPTYSPTSVSPKT